MKPYFAKSLSLTHHSVTSLHYPDGIYAFRYIFCRQEDRRNFESNSNMMGGVAVGDALSYRYANTIWKMNPLTKKLAFVHLSFCFIHGQDLSFVLYKYPFHDNLINI